MATYETYQYGVVPRVMPTETYIGKIGELTVSYCNGQRCIVIHDGVTPGGCWRICADSDDAGTDKVLTCADVIACLNGWTPDSETGCLLKDWSIKKVNDDNILVLNFSNCPSWEIPLPDNDGVINVSWDEEDRQLTVVYDNGTSAEFTIGDKFARLNAAGDTIIFPDGRTWMHCCKREYRGTCGCDYPSSAKVGALHYNGGETGCVTRWDGENWVKVTGIRSGDTFYCTDTKREYTNVSDCNWTQTTDSVCLLPNLPNSYTPDQVFIEVEPCVAPPCNCTDDPNCDCYCDDAVEPKAKLNLQQLAEKMFACLPEPLRFDGCGTNEQVVLTRDNNGCYQLGVLSAAAKAVRHARANGGDVQQPLDGRYVWPSDFDNPYTADDLRTDDNNGTGTINETRIAENIIANGAFTLACQTTFSFRALAQIVKADTIEAAFNNRTSLTWRYRVDGGAWVYPRVNLASGETNVIGVFGGFNGITTAHDETWTRALPAGDIEIQLLAVHSGSPVELGVYTYSEGSGIPTSPVMTLTPVTS